jgi:DnaJ-class molecular chaperone
MGAVSRDHDLGQIPAGCRWCPHCDGYGSSLKDDNDRCAHCHGTGLVAADRHNQAAASPTNGSSSRTVPD